MAGAPGVTERAPEPVDFNGRQHTPYSVCSKQAVKQHKQAARSDQA